LRSALALALVDRHIPIASALQPAQLIEFLCSNKKYNDVLKKLVWSLGFCTFDEVNFGRKALAGLVMVGRRQSGAGGHGQQQQGDDTHLSSVSHLRSRSGARRRRHHRFILAPGLFLFQRHPRRTQLFSIFPPCF
jgi:hypothetical protein